MTDLFASLTSGLESPAAHAYAVTPDDGANLAVACRALNAEVSGNIRVTTVGGDEVTVAVAGGIPFPLRCTKIWATGTTATGIVALY